MDAMNGTRTEPNVNGPQGAGAKEKREGDVYLMDTCIAFRAASVEQADRIATELAAEIRESHRVVLCHIAVVELDTSLDEA